VSDQIIDFLGAVHAGRLGPSLTKWLASFPKLFNRLSLDAYREKSGEKVSSVKSY